MTVAEQDSQHRFLEGLVSVADESNVFPTFVSYLGSRHTGSTRVCFAVSTFEDPPVWSGMAEVTGPLNERVVALDHLERVRAVVLDCYDRYRRTEDSRQTRKGDSNGLEVMNSKGSLKRGLESDSNGESKMEACHAKINKPPQSRAQRIT